MAHQWKASSPNDSEPATPQNQTRRVLMPPYAHPQKGSPLTTNGHPNDPSNGLANGWPSGANAKSSILSTGANAAAKTAHGPARSANGCGKSGNGFAKNVNGAFRSLSEAPGNGFSNGYLDSDDDDDDDDDFYGAEERSCCSDGDYHDATDALEASSDSEGSPHTPTKGHRSSYKSLLARLQEEQAKYAALERSLQQERARLGDIARPSSASKQQGRNGFHHKERDGSTRSLGHSGAQEGGDVKRTDGDDDDDDVTRTHDDDADAKYAVAVMVASAMGRASGKAEVQLEYDAVLQQKDKELSRLRDKLQYWERMNQEMSQQNTEAIEMLRQRRRMWRTVYRVTYVVGAAVLGVGLIAAVNLATSSTRGEPSAESSSSEADTS